jgi:integrase/recombinase XerC
VNLRRYQMGRFANDHAGSSPWSMEPNDLAEWLARHEWSPETLRSYRSALRSFYGWAHASGLVDADPSRLLRKITTPPPRPRPASERVVTAAIRIADERAWLMLMLGSRHGLRRSEISTVHTADISEAIDGGPQLLVRGKGGKLRTVPLLDVLAAAIRAAPAGWLFPNGFGSHLSGPHVGVVLRRLLETGTTSHQLRHRFASRAYQATLDIRAVQLLLGHASVATTQRYVAVADNALRAAVLSAQD